eukprot:COSAG05_NODE_17903_length_317_cov_0.944954_1_plen_68_part_10
MAAASRPAAAAVPENRESSASEHDNLLTMDTISAGERAQAPYDDVYTNRSTRQHLKVYRAANNDTPTV